MQCKFAFGLTYDGRFLVTTEIMLGSSDGFGAGLSTTPFFDENLFIYSVILADLDDEATTSIISQVLLAVSKRNHALEWVSTDLTIRQYAILGLTNPQPSFSPRTERPSFGGANEYDLQDMFMAAPMAICMLYGPEHVFTFVNEEYVRIIGRRRKESVLGKPVRQAMSELNGQPFFRLLDLVFRTGAPHVGTEVFATLMGETSGVLSGRYFDFIYHPVRDKEGKVCGILCQTTDVTDRVIERQVGESREAQLYQQWAELDTIYRDGPMAICLVDAKDFRILRINEKKAALAGETVEALLGRCALDFYPGVPELRGLYERVRAGETITNYKLMMEFPATPGVQRSWMVTFSPCFNAMGNVETIASIAFEVTDTATDVVYHEETALIASA